MHEDRFQFKRGAIRPLECVVDGWRLIKSDYWFFLGVTFVGMLVAQMAPLDILMGPAMCGIHICLLRQMNGQRVSFEMLFQGFNYFGPGLLATIIMITPALIFGVLYMILMFGGMFGIGAWMEQQQAQGGANPVMGLWMMLALYVVMTLGLIVISAIFQAIFLFAFPLIVDREMTGWEAVTTSVRAAFANLGGVLAIVFIELFFVLIGVLFCIIGAYFVLPISFAMTAVAYRQVFPAADPFADYEPDPELPAPVVVSKDTGVQSLEPRSTGVKDHSVGSNDQQV